MDGRSQIKIHTHGHRFTALSLLWRSPIQVLTDLDAVADLDGKAGGWNHGERGAPSGVQGQSP